jgi:hypothetical protein
MFVLLLMAGLLLRAVDAQQDKIHPSNPSILELRIKIESKGKIVYHLVNNGKKGMVFGMMTCGQSDNWSMNTAAVKLVLADEHGCDKNFCEAHVLEPKQSVDGNFAYVLQNGVRPPAGIRLHFKSCTGTYTGKSLPIQNIWSNAFALKDFGG